MTFKKIAQLIQHSFIHWHPPKGERRQIVYKICTTILPLKVIGLQNPQPRRAVLTKVTIHKFKTKRKCLIFFFELSNSPLTTGGGKPPPTLAPPSTARSRHPHQPTDLHPRSPRRRLLAGQGYHFFYPPATSSCNITYYYIIIVFIIIIISSFYVAEYNLWVVFL